jgi:hypothetical protein
MHVKRHGTDVGTWIRLAKQRGIEASQDPDINDKFRVVVKKRNAKSGELASIVAGMPDVERSEARALLIQDIGTQ